MHYLLALDVGKSNIDYPTRITNYPEEKHLLVKASLSSDAGWSSAFYIHPNELKTNVHKVKKNINKISNTAFNFGGNWQIEKPMGNINGLMGVDYFGRRDINISEKSIKLSSRKTTQSHSLRGGEENEFGLFSSFDWQWNQAEVQGGVRFSYFNQTQNHVSTEHDTAWSGFISLAYPFDNGFCLSANFSTGFRFPNLSERFFTGTTGRGNVIGNPDLKTEQSMSFDLGAKWLGSNLTLGANVFYLNVDDYIERVEVSNNVLSFVNLSGGRIMGAEVESSYFLNDQFSFTISGHFLEGRDDHGNPLADIPSNRILLGLEYKAGQWESLLNLEMRAEKNDQGNSEKDIGSAQLLSAAICFRPHHSVLFSLSGSNLLNEKYYNSADRKATFAEQRSIGFNASWQM